MILYLATLSNWLISFSSFFGGFYWLFYIVSYNLKIEAKTFFFFNFDVFYFLFMPNWLGLSVLCWIRWLMGILVFFSDLRRKAFSFLPLSMLAAAYRVFIMLRYVPSVPNLLRFFLHEFSYWLVFCEEIIYLWLVKL